jgi:hypothetical protein
VKTKFSVASYIPKKFAIELGSDKFEPLLFPRAFPLTKAIRISRMNSVLGGLFAFLSIGIKASIVESDGWTIFERGFRLFFRDTFRIQAG